MKKSSILPGLFRNIFCAKGIIGPGIMQENTVNARNCQNY